MKRVWLFGSFLLSTAAASAGRVAVIMRGESFRAHSHQGSREVGPSGIGPQRDAVLSHIRLALLPLVFDMGYSGADIYLQTQSSPFSDLLKTWYGPYYGDARVEVGYASPLKAMVDSVANSPAYEAMLFARPDVIFKDMFPYALQSANRSKILFTSRTPPRFGETMDNGADRVAGMLMWVPRSYFHNHCLECMFMTESARGILRDQMGAEWELANAGYMLGGGTRHDSDPEKDWNPLYRLAARLEGEDV